MPADSFHLLNEGVCKLMLSRMFESKSAETVATKDAWSRAYRRTKVVAEISRCPRKIDVAHLKGCEFSFLMLAGFPSLIDILEDKDEDHW